MNNPVHLTGMPEVVPNTGTKEIRFLLTASDGPPVIYAGTYGVIAQIISGLATAFDILKAALVQEGGVVQIAPIPIRHIQIQKALLADQVLIEITSALGVPYAFEVPVQDAIRIADRLKSAASEDRPMGTA